MINLILEETLKEKDFECAKFCMILSQTFYKVSAEESRPRVFLQELIEGHEIWKQIEFWEGMIKHSINEELDNKHSYNYQSESDDERNQRTQSIAFGQLLSFSYNMLSFEIGKDKVGETINNFCKVYKLQKELSEQITKSVEDYSEKVDQQVKMDVIEDNMSNISGEGEIESERSHVTKI